MFIRVSDYAWLGCKSSFGIPSPSRFCIILAFLGYWDGTTSVFEALAGSHVSRPDDRGVVELLGVLENE